MDRQEAWRYIGELFLRRATGETVLVGANDSDVITSTGLCGAARRLMDADKIASKVYYDMQIETIGEVRSNTPYGIGYICPEPWTVEHTLDRAMLCLLLAEFHAHENVHSGPAQMTDDHLANTIRFIGRSDYRQSIWKDKYNELVVEALKRWGK